MICKTIEEAVGILVTKIVEERAAVITVNTMPDVLKAKSVLPAVCEADPRLILCISSLQIRTEYCGMWSRLEVHISYTDFSPASISKVDSISDYYNVAYHAACLHSREFAIVYPTHMYEIVQETSKGVLELPQFLNCFVSGVSSEIKRINGCSYMAQIVRFCYSCSYREWKKRNKEIFQKTSEIVKSVGVRGGEDWKKAYEVVRYCVTHWKYGRCNSSPGLEYTSYGAIVNNIAVCMGIALAVCTIFKELGIPCRYVRGTRNGEGHAWNMVYLRNGWFYIDVADAICRKDPLFHWGMTNLQDRILCEEISEKLTCNCTSEYIRKMTT